MKKILFLILFLQVTSIYVWSKNVKIAIIGHNVPGALCAYYLKRLIKIKNLNINIDVYDDEPKSRENTEAVHINFRYINEILKENRIKDFLSIYPSARPVIYDGLQNDPLNAKLLRKKNLENFQNLKEFLQKFLKTFRNIYLLQNQQKRKFANVFDLFKMAHKEFADYFKMSTSDFLEQKIKKLIDDKNIDNYIRALIIDNYMQDIKNTHSFAGLTALAFSEITGKLKKIPGYPKNFITMLFGEKITLYKSKILTICREGNLNFILSDIHTKISYNFVIFAKYDTDIKFDGFGKNIEFPKCKKFYTTPVTGNLKKEHTGIQKVHAFYIPTIINVINTQLLNTIPGFNLLWGFSSLNKIQENEVHKFFEAPQIGEEIEMCYYPNYSDYESAEKISFVLAENLYNVKAIEYAGVSLELFAISAKNIALLIKDKI